MTVIEAFRRNVKEELNNIHWSQAELARVSGISKHTINGLLNGHHGPSLYTAYQIANALDVTLDWLTEGADE